MNKQSEIRVWRKYRIERLEKSIQILQDKLKKEKFEYDKEYET